MKKILLSLALSGFFLSAIFFMSGCSARVGTSADTTSFCVPDTCFSLEVVRTPEDRARGLMFRERLDLDKGMLFVFDEPGEYSFWMKDTHIPLDMIWINSNNVIVEVEHDVPPCKTVTCPSYGGNLESSMVIELNAGMAERYNISEGERIIFQK